MTTRKTTNILDLAEHVILYLFKNNVEITHLKLQKILYYVQAWSLVYHDNQLYEELPQAWVNGPVYTSVYRKYKSFGFQNISLPDVDVDNVDLKSLQKEKELSLDPDQINLINAVINRYGEMSPIRLVHLTHAEQPWNDARAGLNPFERGCQEITRDSMKNYYYSLVMKKESAQAV